MKALLAESLLTNPHTSHKARGLKFGTAVLYKLIRKSKDVLFQCFVIKKVEFGKLP